MSDARGRIPIQRARNDYTSTSVTTAAWVQLVSSCPRSNLMEIFDSSGRVMELSFGAAGSESSNIIPLYIIPGGNPLPIKIPVSEGQRLSIRAVDGNATTGQITVTFYN